MNYITTILNNISDYNKSHDISLLQNISDILKDNNHKISFDEFSTFHNIFDYSLVECPDLFKYLILHTKDYELYTFQHKSLLNQMLTHNFNIDDKKEMLNHMLNHDKNHLNNIIQFTGTHPLFITTFQLSKDEEYIELSKLIIKNMKDIPYDTNHPLYKILCDLDSNSGLNLKLFLESGFDINSKTELDITLLTIINMGEDRKESIKQTYIKECLEVLHEFNYNFEYDDGFSYLDRHVYQEMSFDNLALIKKYGFRDFTDEEKYSLSDEYLKNKLDFPFLDFNHKDKNFISLLLRNSLGKPNIKIDIFKQIKNISKEYSFNILSKAPSERRSAIMNNFNSTILSVLYNEAKDKKEFSEFLYNISFTNRDYCKKNNIFVEEEKTTSDLNTLIKLKSFYNESEYTDLISNFNSIAHCPNELLISDHHNFKNILFQRESFTIENLFSYILTYEIDNLSENFIRDKYNSLFNHFHLSQEAEIEALNNFNPNKHSILLFNEPSTEQEMAKSILISHFEKHILNEKITTNTIKTTDNIKKRL